MNSNLLQIISNMIYSQKLPHALLFYGDKGIGKKFAARETAVAILCKNAKGITPCNNCASCHLIKSNSHPDLIEAEHSGKRMGISVATARKICADASIAPNTSDNKVYLLLDADSMETTAQNALLKVIEEPPENVYFIITAQNKTAFLPTILSRVVSVGVGECSKSECINALKEHGINDKEAENAYTIYGGNIGKCLDSISNESQKKVYELVTLLCNCIISRNEYEFLKICHSFENDTESCKKVLCELSLVFRDASVTRIVSDNSYGICKKGSKDLSQFLSFNRADELYNATNNAYLDIKSNVSPKLVLCSLSALIFA